MVDMYMYFRCAYGCYVHVYRCYKWVICTCILGVYMGTMYMYIDDVYGCYMHVY